MINTKVICLAANNTSTLERAITKAIETISKEATNDWTWKLVSISHSNSISVANNDYNFKTYTSYSVCLHFSLYFY